MRFYGLSDKVSYKDSSGGKTLLEIVKIDPQYIEHCVLKDDFFCLTESIIQALKAENPNFKLSQRAMRWLYKKYDYWVYSNVENEADRSITKYAEDDRIWYASDRHSRFLQRYYRWAHYEPGRHYWSNFRVFANFGKEAIVPLDLSLGKYNDYRNKHNKSRIRKEEPEDGSPHYDENLDLDQQSMEFWNNI